MYERAAGVKTRPASIFALDERRAFCTGQTLSTRFCSKVQHSSTRHMISISQPFLGFCSGLLQYKPCTVNLLERWHSCASCSWALRLPVLKGRPATRWIVLKTGGGGVMAMAPAYSPYVDMVHININGCMLTDPLSIHRDQVYCANVVAISIFHTTVCMYACVYVLMHARMYACTYIPRLPCFDPRWIPAHSYQTVSTVQSTMSRNTQTSIVMLR